MLKNYLWITPFISFIIGYYLLSTIYTVDSMLTPTLVSKNLYEVIPILSRHNLNIRLLAEKEDSDLPEGTILSQTPSARTKIKPNQAVFCVVSKKPQKFIAPTITHKSINSITKELSTIGIRTKNYYFQSKHPKNWCFAQYPQANQYLEDNTIISYVSTGTTKPVLFPNLKDEPVHQIQEFLASYNITPEIVHTGPLDPNHTCTHCFVADHRPLAGSIITLSSENTPHVQIRVQLEPCPNGSFQ